MTAVFEPTVMVSSVMTAVLVPAVVVSTIVLRRAAIDLRPGIDGGVAGIFGDGRMPAVGRRRSIMTARIEFGDTGIRAAAREQHSGEGRGNDGTKQKRSGAHASEHDPRSGLMPSSEPKKMADRAFPIAMRVAVAAAHHSSSDAPPLATPHAMMFGGFPLGARPFEACWFLALGAHRVVAHAFLALPATPAHGGRTWALHSLCNRVVRADPASPRVAQCARCQEILARALAASTSLADR